MESGPKPYLTFRVAGRNFAIEACRVRAIVPVEELTPFPGMGSSAVLGIASLSGRTFAVLDLRVKLDLPQDRSGSRLSDGIAPRIVVARVSEHLAGFIADRVSDVHAYYARDLRGGWLRGLGRPRRLLDVEKIIGHTDLVEFWQPGSRMAPMDQPLATETAPAALPR